MKKKYLFLDFFEFFAVFFIFVAPSLLVEHDTAINLDLSYDFFTVFIRILLSIYLVLRLIDEGILTNNNQITIKRNKIPQYIAQGILVYIIIVCIALVFSFLAKFINIRVAELTAIPPQGFLAWAWFLFSIIVLACFEEVLFRLYLPLKLRNIVFSFFQNKVLSTRSQKIITLILECIIISFFAIGHCYLGVVAMITAFFSGVVFRIAIIKYKNIFPTCTAHAINNIVSFIVVFYTN